MAFTIPETIAVRSATATPGERKVFLALREHLPQDYLVYYDLSVSGRHPDFIIVGPDLGLVILEVKDWRLHSIAGATKDQVSLRQSQGEITVKNPLQQVREYALRTADLLKRRPLLLDGDRLRCAWGYGVVFPFLSPVDVTMPLLFGPGLEEVLDPIRVLTGADLSAAVLLPRLRRLLPGWATRVEPLTPLHLNELRGVLYPEIRIGSTLDDDEVLQVMDREQERIARTLGDGHRLVRGVAGSGKTVILICRARHLREWHPDWRVLVLCYNKVSPSTLHRTSTGGR
jgi:hypothetical protein